MKHYWRTCARCGVSEGLHGATPPYNRGPECEGFTTTKPLKKSTTRPRYEDLPDPDPTNGDDGDGYPPPEGDG